MNWLAEGFATLRGDAVAAWQGIGDALAAGDIGLAAKVLWLTLKMEWQRGVAALSPLWNGFKAGFVKTAWDAWYGAIAAAQFGIHGIEVAWIETTAFLSSAWTRFTATMHKVWNWVVAKVKQGLNLIRGAFDESFDAAAANQALQKGLEADNAQIDAEKDARLRARENIRAVERTQAAQVHQAALAHIGTELEAKQQAADAQRDANVRASQDALAEARSQWEASLGAAAKRREEAQRAGPPGARRPPEGLLADVDISGQAKDKLAVSGTFSGAALWGMGTGGVNGRLDRIAAACEGTKRATEKINMQDRWE